MRTCIASLCFTSADACLDALAPSTLDEAQRTVLRTGFNRGLASVNNRPPTVEIDARYLLISGWRAPPDG